MIMERSRPTRPPKQKRRKFFRNVRIRLTCGHDCVLQTSNFRLTKDRIHGLVSNAMRQGMLGCTICNGAGHPRRVIRTERGAEVT